MEKVSFVSGVKEGVMHSETDDDDDDEIFKVADDTKIYRTVKISRRN